MTDERVERWLRTRQPAPPPALLHAMLDALRRVPSVGPLDLSAFMGEAALLCLRDALARGSHREAALPLLAADALLTYGCEAAAEAGPSAVDRFAEQYGAARLAELMPEPA